MSPPRPGEQGSEWGSLRRVEHWSVRRLSKCRSPLISNATIAQSPAAQLAGRTMQPGKCGHPAACKLQHAFVHPSLLASRPRGSLAKRPSALAGWRLPQRPHSSWPVARRQALHRPGGSSSDHAVQRHQRQGRRRRQQRQPSRRQQRPPVHPPASPAQRSWSSSCACVNNSCGACPLCELLRAWILLNGSVPARMPCGLHAS